VQVEAAEQQADAWNLTEVQRGRWRRIVGSSGIERRHGVADLTTTFQLSTARRMEIFDREAPPLAAQAARDAIAAADVAAHEVTDVVVVTCTGFAAPGIGHALVPLLGLTDRVRHNQIGFMGCFGGVVGLRTACGLACADPSAIVLVVCIELCSLHLRGDTDPQQLVASSLFADGAAAAVVRGDPRGPSLGALSPGRTRLLAHAREAMTWRILDDGFAMTLTRDVPRELEASIAAFVAEDLPHGLAIHPGGAGIIDAIERGLRDLSLDPRSFAASRAVLRGYGNMSSGSVLFVLDEYLRQGGPLPLDVLAFGPGLTVDAVRLRRS